MPVTPVLFGLGLVLLLVLGGRGAKADEKKPEELPPLPDDETPPEEPPIEEVLPEEEIPAGPGSSPFPGASARQPMPEGALPGPAFPGGVPGASMQPGGYAPGDLDTPGIPGEPSDGVGPSSIPGDDGLPGVPGDMNSYPPGTVPGEGIDSMPGVPTVPGNPGAPATVPGGAVGVPGPTASDIARKRSIIDKAFKAAVDKRRGQLAKNGQSESMEASVAAVREYFKAQGVPLDGNPGDATWRLADREIADRMARVVNAYEIPGKPGAAPSAPTGVPGKPPVATAPTGTPGKPPAPTAPSAPAGRPPAPTAPAPMPVPTTSKPPLPAPPVPAPVPTPVPPTPQAQVETAPVILEEKRKLVAAAFQKGVERRQQGSGSAAQAAAAQASAQAQAQAVAQAAQARTEAEQLEAKRKLVAASFEDAVNARESYESSVEAKGKQQKIDPFWLQDDTALDNALSAAVESILPGPSPATPAPKTAPRAPAPPKPKASVKPQDDPQKQALVKQGLNTLITHARNTFKSRLGKDYPQSWANDLGREYQRMLLLDRTGKQMSALLFFAMPLPMIQAQVNEAVRVGRKTVDQQADFYALTPQAYLAKYPSRGMTVAQVQAVKSRGVPVAGVMMGAAEYIGAANSTAAARRKKAVNNVASLYKKAGVPLSKPDPKVAFWRMPIETIRARLAAVRAQIPSPVAVAKAPVTNAQLEVKRQKIAAAFERAVARRRTNRPKESPAASRNFVVAQWKKRKIPLTKPPVVSGMYGTAYAHAPAPSSGGLVAFREWKLGW